MKTVQYFLTVMLIGSWQFVLAQSFVEKVQNPSLIGSNDGDISFADIDDDMDLDMLITGYDWNRTSGRSVRSTRLYLNDGFGNYTEDTLSAFLGVVNSATEFADVDGDSDMDLMISGAGRDRMITNLYHNDGSGRFTKAVDTPFEQVGNGDLAFGDFDGDQDQDLIIFGYNDQSISSTKLYINDGQGKYTEKSASFDSISDGSISIVDVDNDQDMDVFLQGWKDIGGPTSQLYINDGNANFTPSTGTSFELLEQGEAIFTDVNKDQYSDLLLIGKNDDNKEVFASIYLNDGSANFTKLQHSGIQGRTGVSVAFADLDRDSDLDVVMIGNDTNHHQRTELYLNDGFGTFSIAQGMPFVDLSYGSVALADVDGDTDVDIVIAGTDSSNKEHVKLYINQDTTLSIRTVNRPLSLQLGLFPNPAQGNYLNIQSSFANGGQAIVSLYNLQGILISEKPWSVQKGENHLKLDISDTPAGHYLLEVIHHRQRGTTKVIIQQ